MGVNLYRNSQMLGSSLLNTMSMGAPAGWDPMTCLNKALPDAGVALNSQGSGYESYGLGLLLQASW